MKYIWGAAGFVMVAFPVMLGTVSIQDVDFEAA